MLGISHVSTFRVSVHGMGTGSRTKAAVADRFDSQRCH